LASLSPSLLSLRRGAGRLAALPEQAVPAAA
jgi:hypothetical protein